MAEQGDSKPQQTAVAVVGMNCLFPDAYGLQQYWRLLRWAEDTISEVPESHWPARDYFSPDAKTSDVIDRTYCARGGFLKPIDFDPTEFGIPPAVLEATDTAQLLGLVVAKAALEDAGYGAAREFDRTRCSVILGVTSTLELTIPLGARLGHPIWKRALEDAGIPEEIAQDVIQRIAQDYVPWQESSFPGLLGNVVAGRIANRLDLRGTNCVVDAACASSLSALHLAVLELTNGQTDMVLTGGVDTFNDIFMFMCFAKTGALSVSGDAKPFSADADGTVIGEGVGMLVLKRLADAERDGDHIHAVIRGIGSSSDGKSQSIYAPRAEGQAEALRKAYENAGVSPTTIGLVEAHGTGTKVGDIVEFSALDTVFREADSSRKGWCAVGSVKSQIGHTKAAAGVASLIKAALALEHKVLLPTIKTGVPNPKLKVEDSPFYLCRESRPWFPENDQPRRAAVSAFGFGGSNFHAVLEEYQATKPEPVWDGLVQIVAFSADTPDQLDAQLAEWEKQAVKMTPAELAWKAQCSREQFQQPSPCRLLIVHERGQGLPDQLARARTKLRSGQGSDAANGIYVAVPGRTGKLAFIFPGQGSQYLGMGRDLVCAFPEAFDSVLQAGMIREDLPPLWDFLYPRAAGDEKLHSELERQLTQTNVAQPAIGAISLAMMRVLGRFGVEPEFAAGHSYGELVALRAGKRIDDDTLRHLSRVRGRLMSQASEEKGGMLAVQAPLEEIDRMIAEEQIDLVLANRNAPQQGVLSGRLQDLDRARAACEARRWPVRQLQVSAAFHSKLMVNAYTAFQQALANVEIAPGNIPVYANSTGDVYQADTASARQNLALQLISPVRFVQEIEGLYAAGVRTFVEVGPKSAATGLVKKVLEGRPHHAVSMDSSAGKRPAVLDLARTLAQLSSLGFNVDLRRWECQVTEPRKPNMAIPLCGANYRPERTARMQKSEKKVLAPAPQNIQSPPSAANPVLPAPDLNVDAGQLGDVLRTVQEGLRAMQNLQEQTAAAHQRFLEGQEQAQRSFQMVLHAQQQLFEHVMGVPPSQLPMPAIHKAAAQSVPGAASNPTGQAISMAQAPPTAVPPAVMPSAHAGSNGSKTRIVIENGLFEVVAELTGYPREMLEPEMDLEADLGIDSIKRVEILAAIQKRIPELPAVDSAMMGSLRTLSQIVDFLCRGSFLPAAGPVQKSAAAQSADVEQHLLSVVSELTGYPQDMLELDMDMEADLGIDSIKRVEILAALQKRLPELPAVDSAYMGTLRTLRQVLDHVEKAFPENTIGAARILEPQAMPPEVSAGAAGLETTLLNVICELTGYPREMLELDMDMESDLGIDSIKRVEILAAVQKQHPELPPFDSTALASMRTLRQMLSVMGGAAGEGQLVTAEPHDTAAEPTATVQPIVIGDPGVTRRTLALAKLQRSDAAPLRVSPDCEIWITDDGSALAGSLAHALEDQGNVCRVVDVANALSARACSRVAGLIILAPAGRETGQLWEESAEQFLKNCFRLAKTLGRDLRAAASEGLAFFVTITRMDGRFGLSGSGFNPVYGGLSGLAKTAGHEWPEVRCRSLDVAAHFNDAEQIAHELACDGPVEVGLSEGVRYGLELTQEPVEETGLPFGTGDVVVVTGGARGVTAESAFALARACRPTLLLLGRSPVPETEPAWLAQLNREGEIKQALLANDFPQDKKPQVKLLEEKFRARMANREILRNIQRIEAAGSRVIYRSTDVRDATALSRTLEEIRSTVGPIRGIVHAAGVIEDRLIEEKTVEQFERVFDTKVAGLRLLLEATRHDELKAVAFFSSISGRFGRQGQVDYAMANEVLNKAAERISRLHPDCRTVSINWGPWDGGMVSPELKREFGRLGIGVIPLEPGARAFVRELALSPESAAEVVLGTGIEKLTLPHRSPRIATGVTGLPVVFERDLDVETHPFLRSHVLAGKPVLPAAVAMEWLAYGALHNNPGLQLHGFDQFRVYRGVILHREPVRVQICASKAVRNGSVFELEVELRSGDGTTHCKARAVLADSLPEAPAYTVPDELKNSVFKRTAQTIYRDVLFHGPHFHGIETVETCPEAGMIARLRTAPAPSEWMTAPLRSSWVTDPLVTDAVLQMGIVWCHEHLGLVGLPSRGDSYRQYRGSIPKETIFAVLEVLETTTNTMKADVLLIDRQGNLLAQFAGYEWTVDESMWAAYGKGPTAESKAI